jgi:hypothetical protein
MVVIVPPFDTCAKFALANATAYLTTVPKEYGTVDMEDNCGMLLATTLTFRVLPPCTKYIEFA